MGEEQMKNRAVFAAGVLALLAVAPSAHAVLYNFQCVSPGQLPACNVLNNQLSVDVTQVTHDFLSDDPTGTIDAIQFEFKNNVGTASAVHEIYFKDGLLLFLDDGTIFTPWHIINSGTDYKGPTANPADPPDLTWTGTVHFAADATGNPDPNMLNASSDSVKILFALQSGQTLSDVTTAIVNGGFNIALHVGAIGTSGYSATYTLNPIPEPGFYGVLALGLAGLAWFRFRKPA
jgi:hypothetical protein